MACQEGTLAGVVARAGGLKLFCGRRGNRARRERAIGLFPTNRCLWGGRMAVRVVSSDSPPPSPPRSGSYGSGLMQPDMKQAFGLRRRFGGDEPRAAPWAGIKQA